MGGSLNIMILTIFAVINHLKTDNYNDRHLSKWDAISFWEVVLPPEGIHLNQVKACLHISTDRSQHHCPTPSLWIAAVLKSISALLLHFPSLAGASGSKGAVKESGIPHGRAWKSRA